MAAAAGATGAGVGGVTGGVGAVPIRREEDGALDTWSRQVLSRADGGGNSFLFPPTHVTFQSQSSAPTAPPSVGGGSNVPSALPPPVGHPEAPHDDPTLVEPLAPLTPWQWVLQKHSVLGLCFHVDVEGAFTKPLKAYFVACSVLLVVFLSLRIHLATAFAEFLIVASLLHAVHWLQRFVFYKFQDSHLLWPFLAAAVVLTLAVYDLYGFATVGGEALRHGLGMAIAVYLFGFLLPEALFLGYRYHRQGKKATLDGVLPVVGVGHVERVVDEAYSTL